MAPTTLSPAYPVLQKLCDASAVLEKPLRWCGNIGVVFFFLMVVIAAITSVMSLIEVATQFVIQKFRADRKISALIVAGLCFLVSIPVGISLGHVAILGEDSPALFGLDWLTFFDEVTNTVLMPVCALFACIAVGWIIKPRAAIREMEDEGCKMAPWLEKTYAVMIRYITPLLIVIVEIGGLAGEIEAGNIAVVVFAYALIAVCAIVYFAFLRDRDTGCNADERVKR